MEKNEKAIFWTPMIAYLNDTWKFKKGFGYTFRGKDFKELKAATRNFQPWQIMALWDVFLESDREWIKKTGYSISSFLSCLVWLVDDKSWKHRAAAHELKLVPPMPQEIQTLLNLKIGVDTDTINDRLKRK